MTRRILAAVAVVLLAFTGCGGSEPDVAACKAAMKEQFKQASEDPGSAESARPSACNGVDDATLQRIAGEIMSEAIDGN